MTQPSHDTCAAFVGIDWAGRHTCRGLQAAGSTKRERCQLEPTPVALAAWVTARRPRLHGPPVALCLALNQGPLGFAWRPYALLVLCRASR